MKYQTKAKELQKELDAERKKLSEAERKKMPVEEGGGVASKVDMRHIQYLAQTLPPDISVSPGIT